MSTQKFMGKGQLVQRLAAQLRTQKNPPADAEAMAHGILQKRGQMDASGKLTDTGQKRNAMTAEERAKDRASKKTGKPKTSFAYNPRTNQAKVR